jgi:ketosteroid isomerase-like protein
MLVAAGCSPAPQPAPDTRSSDEAAIREADAGWSKAFGARQLDAAVNYNAADATMLAPNIPMAPGKDAIRKVYEQLLAIPGFSISWQPAKVEVARSGDVGYSRGTYELGMNDAKGNLMTDRGKYLTVWKKQADGTWKSVADMFNSDVPAQAPPAK